MSVQVLSVFKCQLNRWKVVEWNVKKSFPSFWRLMIEDDLKLGMSTIVYFQSCNGSMLRMFDWIISLIGKFCPYVGSDTLVRVI